MLVLKNGIEVSVHANSVTEHLLLVIKEGVGAEILSKIDALIDLQAAIVAGAPVPHDAVWGASHSTAIRWQSRNRGKSQDEKPQPEGFEFRAADYLEFQSSVLGSKYVVSSLRITNCHVRIVDVIKNVYFTLKTKGQKLLHRTKVRKFTLWHWNIQSVSNFFNKI